MATERNQSNESVVWDMYLKKCKQEGTKPSIEDFKAWTKSILAKL